MLELPREGDSGAGHVRRLAGGGGRHHARASRSAHVHEERFDEGDLAPQIDAYDRRRAAMRPYRKQRDPARWGGRRSTAGRRTRRGNTPCRCAPISAPSCGRRDFVSTEGVEAANGWRPLKPRFAWRSARGDGARGLRRPRCRGPAGRGCRRGLWRSESAARSTSSASADMRQRQPPGDIGDDGGDMQRRRAGDARFAGLAGNIHAHAEAVAQLAGLGHRADAAELDRLQADAARGLALVMAR